MTHDLFFVCLLEYINNEELDLDPQFMFSCRFPHFLYPFGEPIGDHWVSGIAYQYIHQEFGVHLDL